MRPPDRPKTRIGVYDHAINAQEALRRLPPALTSVGDYCERITAKLVRHADRVSAEPDIRAKRALIGRLEKRSS
jgi:hypothetical protein